MKFVRTTRFVNATRFHITFAAFVVTKPAIQSLVVSDDGDASGSATLAGLPKTLLNRMQYVLHAAARLILRMEVQRRQLLHDLHCPRAPERLAYRLAVYVFLSTGHCITLPLCWTQSSCRWWLLKAASISKHSSAYCHSTNEALDDWWPRAYDRGGMHLEQFKLSPFVSSSPSLSVIKRRLKTELFKGLYPAT